MSIGPAMPGKEAGWGICMVLYAKNTNAGLTFLDFPKGQLRLVPCVSPLKLNRIHVPPCSNVDRENIIFFFDSFSEETNSLTAKGE